MASAKDLTIDEKCVVREALALLTDTAEGVIFAVDPAGSLTGVLTDGDIRRALLAGRTLEDEIRAVMTTNYVALPVEASESEIVSTFSRKIAHIPLLDQRRRPVDFASRFRTHQIPVLEPSLDGNELNYVMECIKTNWISSQGRFVRDFERQFASYHHAEHALAVSSGTTALHLALVSLGIGPGDEVIVPDLTFAASVNAVIHAGATPVLVDVDERTWNIDPHALREKIGPETRAIMPVHLYGHPCDMEPICDIAHERQLLIVEDCAEAVGALYKGKLVGGFGDAACFSFFGNKLITTGEGGMVLFRSQSHHERACRLRDHGMEPKRRYWHTEVGYNYRLTNMQAAVGLAQLERIDQFIERKRTIARAYSRAFEPLSGIELPPNEAWADNVYWVYTVLVDERELGGRDLLQKQLQNAGIDTRQIFYPLHEMPPYQHLSRGETFPSATRIARQGISLPSGIGLTDEQQQHVIDTMANVADMRRIHRAAASDSSGVYGREEGHA